MEVWRRFSRIGSTAESHTFQIVVADSNRQQRYTFINKDSEKGAGTAARLASHKPDFSLTNNKTNKKKPQKGSSWKFVNDEMKNLKYF